MPGAAPELARPSMTLEPSPSGRESTLSSFSALQAASPTAWSSRCTYSCHFACRKTRRRPSQRQRGLRLKGCLAAFHSQASSPRTRPPSSFPTRKVAGIGARRDLERQERHHSASCGRNIAHWPGPPAHAIPPWSPLTPEHFFRHACAHNSPSSHLSLAAGFTWDGRDGAVDTCQRASTT